MRRLGGILVALTLTGGFYLLLIDTTAGPELYAGAAIVLVATAAFEVSREQGARLAEEPRAWARELRRALVRVPRESAELTLLAVRQAIRPVDRVGRLRTHTADAERVSQRARREILGSLSPGSIVIGHDDSGNRERLHELTVSR